MAWRHAFSPDIRIIVVSGDPGTGKTKAANFLGRLLQWPVYSLGNELRNAHMRSGSKLPFEIWVAKIRPQKLRRIHKKWVRKLRKKSHVIVDMRYPEFFGNVPWLLTIYFDGNLMTRAEWCAENEQDKYPGLSAAEIAKILNDRKNDERRAAFGMRLYRHDDFEYDIMVNSPEYTEWNLATILLEKIRTKNRDLALARSPRFFNQATILRSRCQP